MIEILLSHLLAMTAFGAIGYWLASKAPAE